MGEETVTAPIVDPEINGRRGEGNKLFYWSMDDTILGTATPFQLGSLKDTSNSGDTINLNITGADILDTTGINGKGLFIDGYNNSSYAVSDNLSGDTITVPFSFLCHFKANRADQPGERGGIIGIFSYSSGSYAWNLSYVSTSNILRIRFDDGINVGVVNINNPTEILDNNWHLIGFNL